MSPSLAVTWWGHSCVTIELGSRRIGTDPMLTDRVVHLRRNGPSPTVAAADVDVVLVSHLHRDHLHVPSLGIIAADAPIVLARGGGPLVRSLSGRTIIEVEPGDHLEISDVRIEVLPARHDGRRGPLDRRHPPALGFRVQDGAHSFWYPGDTGVDRRMLDVDAVDLAVVPIGGWGPTLGDEHLDPEEAAMAVAHLWAPGGHCQSTSEPCGRLVSEFFMRPIITACSPLLAFDSSKHWTGKARPSQYFQGMESARC